MRRLAVATAVVVFTISSIGASSAGAQAPSEPRRADHRGRPAEPPTRRLRARPYVDSYGPGIEATCSNVAAIKAITGAGTTAGEGSTLGDANGRVVIRTQTRRTTNVRSAKKLMTALSTPEYAALLGGAVLSGVVAQYPVLPTLTYGAPVDADGVVSVPFTGASSIGPLAGTLLITQVDNTIGLAAVRVSRTAGRPGRVGHRRGHPDVQVRNPRAGATPPPTEKVAAAATALGSKLKQTFTTVTQENGATDLVAQDTPTRRGAGTYPLSCGRLAAAYTYSGARAATSGAAIQGSGGKVQGRVEGIAFPTAKQAQIYANYYNELDTCLGEIWGTPAGMQASGIVRKPRTGVATGRRTARCSTSAPG